MKLDWEGERPVAKRFLETYTSNLQSSIFISGFAGLGLCG